MKHKTGLILLSLALVFSVALWAEGGSNAKNDSNAAASASAAEPAAAPMFPASPLFDSLTTVPDVVYLIANSSVVFGPDPHGRSEEVTFIGPVTVPKWPMAGYERRVLPDGRQQIDIELTQSELTGESYVMHGPIVLGEHPDLRSLGTITERASAKLKTISADGSKPQVALASYHPESAQQDQDTDNAARKKITDDSKKLAAVMEKLNKPRLSAAQRETEFKDARKAVEALITDVAKLDENAEAAEEVPADFVVLRKVLLTTAKGILYNETAVPVRGRIDSIPPVKFQSTAEGVNVFRGMELPVALLDRDGNVNGWFYSKAHMAYAVLPKAVERSYVTGTVQLKSGDKTEQVQISGPAEIHHLTTPGSGKSSAEVMMLALRGHSDLLGGDIMFSETFGDRDHFSRGELKWNGDSADSKFDLFVDVYTPSSKLTAHDAVPISGRLVDCKENGKLEKGKLSLPLMSGKGQLVATASRVLYDEAEKPAVEISQLQLNLTDRK
jgi:hypothetical protein